MARIKSISEYEAKGIRRATVWHTKRRYGYLPGIFKLLLSDLTLASHAGAVYTHLQLRKRSPLSRLRREMLATVVNGHLGGAP